ncbi:MAG: DUF4347 domain-containing protein, partial [Nitrospiraceae bacterium]|nr:DUF4347 domain-containing protein [Nitrospiraceae bacterium]
MRILRRHKPTSVKPARGRRHASADARVTLSTFGGSLLALESRIMFDGAAVATVSTVTTEQIAQSQAEASFSADDAAIADNAPDAPTGEPRPTIGDQALFDALAVYDTSVARQEIVFLSSSVLEYQQLLDGLSPNVEVHILDPARDGVEQMAQIIAGRTGIHAIHLIGEGTEAEMHLGASFLTQDSISTRYAEQFQQIGQSLSTSADLLIYGCNFGRGDAGQLAMQTLAELTGADVAASTDRTGHSGEFGNWILEMSTGTIEASVVIGEASQAVWDHALATFTVLNTNDSGANSLRQAIINANALAGSDTINFTIAGAGVHTIAPASALPTISGVVFIDGYTQPGSSVNTLAIGNNAVLQIQLDGVGSGGANGLTLGAGSAGSTIRGLVINRFTRGIQVDSTSNLIVGNWIGVDSTGTVDRGNTNDGITITANNNTIGTLAAADRNLLSGNDDEGVDVDPGFTGIVIEGNYIGTNAMGTAAVANGLASDPDSGGLRLDGNGTIARNNLVSGNLNWGVYVTGTGNVLYGNQIGTNAAGTAGIANSGAGIRIVGGSTHVIGGTAAGQGNTIAFNAGNGIQIESATSIGNAILGNSIFSNTGLGIDLTNNGVTANDAGDGDTGANNLQNFPVLTSAQVVSSTQLTVIGTLNSIANSQFRIGFFSNTAQDPTGFGEGQTYLGFVNVTTDGSGNASFNTTLAATVSAGSYVSAIATKSDPTFTTFTDTSEFAQNVVAANTAPVLDAARSPVLTAINEDAGAPSGAVGTLVSSLVDFASPAGQVDNVTDGDSGALLGIAVTAADTTNGTWFYSTNGGTNWFALGAVANNNARLLAADASTRLYFQPNANYNGTLASAITFRAWDRTSGSNGALADTSTNGGTTAFSTATDTAALTVTAVNDVPVNTVPAAQSTNEDIALVFSVGNGNLISIGDVDAGGSPVQVTLTGTNGTVTLSGTVGLTFSVGDGTADATMTFTGTVANINTALAGLSFSPASNFNGAANLQIITNDQGNTGSGGPLNDTDNVAITVNAANDAPIVVNQGLLFDGVDDKVVVNSSGSLTMTTTVTMEAWVQRQGTPTGTQILINKEGEYELGITSAGVIQWAFANTTPGWNWVSTGYTLPANQWTHIAVSYNAGIVNTYVNGALVHSYNGSGSIGDVYPALNELTLGGRQNASTQRFEGLIDEVRVWNTARTGVQISTNYDQTLTGSESGLAGYWRFAEATGSTAFDLTANANNGTLGGGVPSNEPTRQFTYSMVEDGSLSVSAASGVLANATDAEDSPLTAVLVTGPANAASFTLNPDGSFSYTPVANYFGSDSFVFQASDGSLLSQSGTVVLTITPVNDAPVNTVSAAQSTNEDIALVFSVGNGNLIAISDVDAGASPVRVTLTATNGTVTLAGTAGLTFTVGDGTADATMTFTGTVANINTALNGLAFGPT